MKTSARYREFRTTLSKWRRWPRRPPGQAILLACVVVAVLVATLDPSLAADGEPVRLSSPLRVSGAGSPETGTPLQLDADAYARLQPHRALRLRDFSLSEDERVVLELERFEVTTAETHIVAGTPDGDVPIPHPDIALFRGHVSGAEDSRAILGLSPRGLHGIIWIGEEGYVVAPAGQATGEAGRADHRIQKLSGLPLPPPEELSPFDVLAPQSDQPAPQSPAGQGAAPFRAARVALECDYEYWSRFDDNYGVALDYIAVLFAAIGDMYERDVSVKLALTYIRIWTTADDPYDYVGGDPDSLAEFRDYWYANHSTPGQPGFVERDVAHLLSSRGVGGFGWPGVLCSYDRGYSISGGNATGATPAESLVHDIAVAGHELGHNFDGMHTHCFEPPIDRCATEPGCNDTQDCDTIPSTIMSYCHFCPGGHANILHQFHERNIARMQSHIDTSCLRLARNPAYVDWRNSGYEDGTAAWPYNTIREGADAVLTGGTVHIASGSYPEQIKIAQPMTLNATGGLVTIGE